MSRGGHKDLLSNDLGASALDELRSSGQSKPKARLCEGSNILDAP
jgi:hypothetical protein